MFLCMHLSAHEVVRSLSMAGGERMIETRKSARRLSVLQCKIVFCLSSDVTCDIYTILLYKTTEDLLRYTAQNLEITGCMHSKQT